MHHTWTLGGGNFAIKKSNIKGAGQGVFATKSFSKGDYITYYDGQIISNKEAQRREKLEEHSHFKTVLSGMLVISGLTMPAKGRGAASFVNADRRAECNTEFIQKSGIVDPMLPGSEGWLRRGKEKNYMALGLNEIVLLRAKRDIQDGEEFLVYYKPVML